MKKNIIIEIIILTALFHQSNTQKEWVIMFLRASQEMIVTDRESKCIKVPLEGEQRSENCNAQDYANQSIKLKKTDPMVIIVTNELSSREKAYLDKLELEPYSFQFRARGHATRKPL